MRMASRSGHPVITNLDDAESLLSTTTILVHDYYITHLFL
jgi:hypothetical protein